MPNSDLFAGAREGDGAGRCERPALSLAHGGFSRLSLLRLSSYRLAVVSPDERQRHKIGHVRRCKSLNPRRAYVKVRVACRKCNRSGSYSLARLTAKYGSDITVCERRPALQSRCRAFFIDLDWPPRPPDLLTQGQRRLKVIKGDKSAA